MNLRSVTFRGLYPVGAVAVVATTNSGNHFSAELLLRAKLAELYPGHNPEPIEATPLDLQPGQVCVLLNGDY